MGGRRGAHPLARVEALRAALEGRSFSSGRGRGVVTDLSGSSGIWGGGRGAQCGGGGGRRWSLSPAPNTPSLGSPLLLRRRWALLLRILMQVML